MPASMAACISCANGPCKAGVSCSFQAGNTLSASTRTLSNSTVPLAVVRWPKLDQSSTTVRPAAPRSSSTVTSRSSVSSALVGIQCAYSAPVE